VAAREVQLPWVIQARLAWRELTTPQVPLGEFLRVVPVLVTTPPPPSDTEWLEASAAHAKALEAPPPHAGAATSKAHSKAASHPVAPPPSPPASLAPPPAATSPPASLAPSSTSLPQETPPAKALPPASLTPARATTTSPPPKSPPPKELIAPVSPVVLVADLDLLESAGAMSGPLHGVGAVAYSEAFSESISVAATPMPPPSEPSSQVESQGAQAAPTSGPLKSRLRAIFESIDIDGSGAISRKELAAKLRADGELEALLGVADATTIPQVMRVMRMLDQTKELDADGDSYVSYDEFEAAAFADREAAAKAAAEKVAKAAAAAAQASAVAAVVQERDGNGYQEGASVSA